MSFSVSVAFALKVSSSERRRVVLLKKSDDEISPCGFVYEREASWCSQISGKKIGNLETPTTKTDILIFLKQEKLLAGTIHIKYLISLKAMYGENMKEIDFQLLPQNQEFPHYEYIIGGFPLSPGKIYILVKV